MNQRRLAMMRLMDSRHKFTARELAERFEVSVRTIQRDLDALQTMGFPLYTEVGVNGGYRVFAQSHFATSAADAAGSIRFVYDA